MMIAMRTVMRCFVAAIAALFATAAQAVQLGDPQGRSTAGEPIDLYIPVLTGPSASTATATLTQVAASSTSGESMVDGLGAAVVYDQAGTYVRITSAGPVTANSLRFRVSYDTGGMTLTRSYTIALSRPRPVAIARAEGRAIPNRVQQPVSSAAGRYGPVRLGETLWQIARDLRASHGGSVRDMMNQLLADNPSAFVAGDMNRLKAGVTLVVAADGSIAMDPKAMDPRVENGVAPAAPAPKPPQPQPRGTDLIALAEGSRNPEEASAPVTLLDEPRREPIDWRLLHPERDAELRRLDERFARIRSRYGVAASSSTLAPVLDTRGGAVQPRRSGVTPAATTAVSETEVAISLSPVADAAASPAVASAVATVDAQALSTLQQVAALSVGSLILGALGYRVTRRKAKTSQQQVHQALETERRERVAHKAAQRLELEAEVKRIMEEHRSSMTAQQRPETSGDDLTEVDLSITHGRYQRAELLLKEVLREAPRNVDAKLRLADVYYVTGQTDAFLRIAQDLRAHHRHEIADAEWQKVMRMGRVLRPDDSLFGRLNEVTRELRTA